MGIGYQEFGRRLVETILTADRVEQTLTGVVAGAFETSIRQAAGLVRAEGSGNVSKIKVDTLLDDDILAFVATLDVDMNLVVRVSGVPNRYVAKGKIALTLRPIINDDLSIVIDIPNVTESDVQLKLRPDGAVAAIIDQLGSVEDQVRREVVRFVNLRKDAPETMAQRRIDVTETIDAEWARRSEDQ
jgi:hypothetical protein